MPPADTRRGFWWAALVACASLTLVMCHSEKASAPPLADSSTDRDPLVGKAAPDFTAKSQDGKPVQLSSFKGRPVVLYFYPKDETPGCTTEACSFRDAWSQLEKQNAVLVGISADPADSHARFAAHHALPFLLVSDPDGSIGRAYGVPFNVYHERQTFVVGPDGTVRKVYRHVDVGAHATQILADLSQMR